jgi:hypothetical protein
MTMGNLAIMLVQLCCSTNRPCLHACTSLCIALELFLLDASIVDIIITTRHIQAVEMTNAPVEIGEMEATEAAESFRKCAKLKYPGPDENAQDHGELGVGDHANRVVYRDDATIGMGHPPISAGVSPTTETVTGYESEEAG